MIKDADIAAVFGKRGSGKSTMARHIVAKHKRVLVLDPTLDWQGEGPYTPVSDIADLARALGKRRKNKSFRLVYNIPAGRAAEALHHVSNMLCQFQDDYFHNRDDRQLTLVVEEMAEAYGNQHANRSDLRGFSKVILQGRHYGINVVGVSQRPADIAARFRDNAGSIYVFSLSDHNSREVIEKMTGRDYRETIRKLANFNHLEIRDGNVSKGKVRARRSKR